MQNTIFKIAVIIPCSKTKRKGQLKAIHKYSGRIYKHVLRMQKDYKFDIFIYSAKYGIISENTIIDDYNETFQNMSKKERIKKAELLETTYRIKEISKQYDKVIVSVGSSYMEGLKSEGNIYIIKRTKEHNRKGSILAPATALYDYLAKT